MWREKKCTKKADLVKENPTISKNLAKRTEKIWKIDLPLDKMFIKHLRSLKKSVILIGCSRKEVFYYGYEKDHIG